MKNLIDSWDDIAKGWTDKNIFLFLDYDGTLAPIADNPWKAVLPEENKELVERLAHIPVFQVAIISGRALGDLKMMAGIEGVIYIGNHGWEIEGSSMHFESLISLKVSSIMQKLKYELITAISDIQGAFVEDKGMTLSVHYRLVAHKKESLVRRIFEQICMPYRRQNMVRINTGKKVLELRPPVEWDKGKAVLWLLRKQEILKGKGNVVPVYIGDDASDEEAFNVLKDIGVTVFVGHAKSSAARYNLKGPEDVTEFLKYMLYGAYEKI